MTLCDGRAGLRAMVQIETRVPAPDEIQNQPSKLQNSATPAVLEFISSDDTLDRYSEVLVPSGWRLDNYRRNPVFQNAHQYGDIIFTLGKALITEIREVTGCDGRVRPALIQRIEFAVEANPMARIAYALYQGKFLNAVSVGFIPLRWEDGPGSAECGVRSAECGVAERRSPTNAGCRRKYLEQELLEVSAVGIPANPQALQLGLQAGAIAKSDIQDLLELLRELFNSQLEVQGSKLPAGSAIFHPPFSTLADSGTQTSNCNSQSIYRGKTAGVETNTSALGADANGAQLPRFARALRELLRRT